MDPGRKRIGSIAESATSSNQRSKRAKYAPVACNECKKKKLKCVREEGDEICKRCDVNKVECIFAPTAQPAKEDAEPSRRRSTQEPQTDVTSLSQQVIALQNQVNALTSALQDVSQRLPQITLSSTKSTPQGHPSTYRKDIRNVHNEPREPQFVGPTRSAYSFQIAENSLTGMGIEPNATGTSTPAESPSETEAVVESERLSPGIEDVEILPSLGITEVQRLLDVYNEEIQSVYPFIDVNELSGKAVSVFQTPMENTLKDVQAIKLAVATSVAIEAQGLNNISKRLIDDVEPVICRVSGEAFIDLQELQLMIMLSIYWFHCGEDLLAWRAIGNAGREALEIGLHRRTSLFENFKNPSERDLAIRCFWCVYILDRRWSYGTSLSFGISDRDIDPQCPEPSDQHPYLRCMVSYAKLCSKVWEDLPLDSSPFMVPKDKVDFFDFLTQKWIHSIPDDLQLVYPRLSQAPRHQPRVLQRLRTLLYLRGNYIRNLVLRHHVMSAENLRSDMQGAQLVVSLAQDTIQVLVNLNETSDIYARQKATFNYFLTGALATILLAVCHGPDVFADRCRQSFQDAVRLLKNISQHGQLGRRLWRSLKGTIHRALSLESPITPTGNTALAEILQQETPEVRQQQTLVPTNWPRNSVGNNFMDEHMADMFGLETDLLNLFSAFEQDSMLRPASQVNGLDQGAAALPDQNVGVVQGDDLSRFNGGF
ncbi:putative transcriptional regulatory protein [Fusarium oxysporum f. sp. cubense]|uniref:Putative transcriptional regulatory protein n=1 Tax=Fusarium oxysporum f. sp. cubense TaxID=61366 RepID=A0A559LSV6_FUSOC|nr:putative transcriptional regulatory protein [Fusarium oxysporum f. sp. cubense]